MSGGCGWDGLMKQNSYGTERGAKADRRETERSAQCKPFSTRIVMAPAVSVQNGKQ
ncbi:hypothetical protein BSY240_4687 (plasmid) [Agrobacterium sp. RAC06]|nr:hypothetical protein BSY240_4687 [Agrobacterium sp. RAC06]